jgi:hypothetical protein
VQPAAEVIEPIRRGLNNVRAGVVIAKFSHFANKFTDCLCGYLDIRVTLNPHPIWQATQAQVGAQRCFWAYIA